MKKTLAKVVPVNLNFLEKKQISANLLDNWEKSHIVKKWQKVDYQGFEQPQLSLILCISPIQTFNSLQLVSSKNKTGLN
jgi:hypothetical protein